MCTTSLVMLAVLAQLAPPTTDPQAKARAQDLLSEGSRLYGDHDYAGALEKFNAAYAAYPSPKLLFNIGQASRDLGRPVEALEAFEKFLANDTDASSETAADARKAVAELKGNLGRLLVHCETAGAEVRLDGRSVGVTPVPELIWATPGRHQVTASHAQGGLALENVEVTKGVVQVLTLRLRSIAGSPPVAPLPAPAVAVPAVARDSAPEPSPRPVAVSRGWWMGRTWTWVAAASTVLLAAGSVAAGASMQSKYDSLNASCGRASATQPGCSESDVSSVTARRNLANALWGLTGAAAVTTGLLFYVEGRSVSVSPVAGELTGALARVAF